MIFSKNQEYFIRYRFELISILLITILFGSAIIPLILFENYILPLGMIALGFCAISLAKDSNKIFRLLCYGFVGITIFIVIYRAVTDQGNSFQIFSLSIFILFFSLLSYLVFNQMFLEKIIGHNIIAAAFDCYLLLGLIGAMIFTLIFIMDSNCFTGIAENEIIFDKMLYFSFITLTSIGYGDITPNSQLTEKVASFFGLVGHFYSVVIVGIIVAKYVANKTE